MKALYWTVGAIGVAIAAFLLLNQYIYQEKQGTSSSMRTGTPKVEIVPIEHATAVITFDEAVLYIDPIGGAGKFNGQPAPTIVLVTDIHGDHLNAETLGAVVGNATLIVPQAVKDMLPAELAAKATVLRNGETITIEDFEITGVPMYNLPGADNADKHPKGRGNGYLIERDGYRLYIAGDTAGTPELRALTDIDAALIPMNLPFTMGVDEAADSILAMKPKVAIPYHYREQAGLADVSRFKALVAAGNPDIEVRLLAWYP